MNYEWFVSLRYLRAKRKQTFISVISSISIIGVTLGVAALIVVLAVMTGFHDGVQQQILGNIPHVLVQQQGGAVKLNDQLLKTIGETDRVRAVTPFVVKEAMLLSRGNVAAVNVKGIAADNKVLAQKIRTLDGAPVTELLFADPSGLPGIVIGFEAAMSLGVTLGETINVIPPMFALSPFGMVPKMKPFRVVGVMRQRGGFLDNYLAYVALPIAQSFLEMGEKVSGIEIEVAAFNDARPVSERLRKALGFPYTVRSWEDMFGSLLSALNLEKLGLFIVLAIIVLVAAFNIATTLIMVVMEKHKDIAILRSLGANSAGIMKIFILEGLVIGTLGTTMGIGGGVVLAKNADALIKWLEHTFGVKIFDQAVYGMERFPSVVSMSDVVTVGLVSMTICLVATVYPALRAARMDPAEALRYE
ncbi:MAG: lipoprotein-releasing ABC transporter permease subunit [Desulfuromonadales bacterium]|nr:lipoprotein-releasing ABC transporter permease subunit [Desulfuromonadales bacterium]